MVMGLVEGLIMAKAEEGGIRRDRHRGFRYRAWRR